MRNIFSLSDDEMDIYLETKSARPSKKMKLDTDAKVERNSNKTKTASKPTTQDHFAPNQQMKGRRVGPLVSKTTVETNTEDFGNKEGLKKAFEILATEYEQIVFKRKLLYYLVRGKDLITSKQIAFKSARKYSNDNIPILKNKADYDELKEDLDYQLKKLRKVLNGSSTEVQKTFFVYC